MTTNISPLDSNDGELIAELDAHGFSIALHRDSRLGLVLVLDDLEHYSIQGLNDEAIRCTITAATWRRLAALATSGAVEALIERA